MLVSSHTGPSMLLKAHTHTHTLQATAFCFSESAIQKAGIRAISRLFFSFSTQYICLKRVRHTHLKQPLSEKPSAFSAHWLIPRLESFMEHCGKVERTFWPWAFFLLFDHFKSWDEFLPATTGTLNAHIWNRLTSVLLTELNSFYRLEHILPDSGEKEGGRSALSSSLPPQRGTLNSRVDEKENSVSAVLTCMCIFFPLRGDFSQLWPQTWGRQKLWNGRRQHLNHISCL